MIVKQSSVDPIDFDGLQILDYTAKLDSRSSFAVITIPSGTAHTESWSKRSDKYYYVVTGRVEFRLDGQQQVLSAGDFCVVPQGQHFSYLNRELEGSTDLSGTYAMFRHQFGSGYAKV